MGKMLQLRQGVLASGGDRKRLVELLAASVSTFMVIFRAVLRVHGEEPPTGHEAVCSRLTALTGVDTDAFVRVVQHVRGRSSIGEQDVRDVLSGYLTGAHQVYTHIDRLPTT